jgi:elongator complex protein 4
VIELSSFASSPARLASFPKHSGLLRIPSLPSLGSLVSPSAKLSVLRGLGGGQLGEGSGLDLGFRIKRRRFIIEPLRDDSGIEGVAVVKPVEVPTPLPLKKEVEEVEDDGVIRNSKVRFASEEPTVVVKKKVTVPSGNKPVSISAMLHKSPELYEF